MNTLNGYTPFQVLGADGTLIGNTSDALKVTGTVVTSPIGTGAFGNIYRRQEINVSTKTESDLLSGTGTGSTNVYTVPTDKTFVLTSLHASYDTASTIVVRFKKQTGGSGSFVQEFRIAMRTQAQDPGTIDVAIPGGIIMGTAGDVFKITYEAAQAKGILWASFTGIEY